MTTMAGLNSTLQLGDEISREYGSGEIYGVIMSAPFTLSNLAGDTHTFFYVAWFPHDNQTTPYVTIEPVTLLTYAG